MTLKPGPTAGESYDETKLLVEAILARIDNGELSDWDESEVALTKASLEFRLETLLAMIPREEQAEEGAPPKSRVQVPKHRQIPEFHWHGTTYPAICFSSQTSKILLQYFSRDQWERYWRQASVVLAVLLENRGSFISQERLSELTGYSSIPSAIADLRRYAKTNRKKLAIKKRGI